jgi:PDZ domain
VIVAASLLAGCGGDIVEADSPPAPDPPIYRRSVADDARMRFARAFDCPEVRVNVTPVDGRLMPPPDSAKDPDPFSGGGARPGLQQRLFDVSGCNHQVRFACPPVAPGGDPLCVIDATTAAQPATSVDGEVVDDAAKPSDPWQGRSGGGAGFEPAVGVVVRKVATGGPADGKLRVGDVILSAGGQQVQDERMLQAIIRSHAGSLLDIRLRRGEQVVGTAITVSPR